MKYIIDTEQRTFTTQGPEGSRTQDLYSREAFEELSRQWVRVGWSLSYYRTFTWMGLPVLQLPEDLVRLQQAIWEVRPDVIVETGVFHGGSMVFHASLCRALGKGRVIGVDIAIRPEVRSAIERHPLGEWVTLIEGDSASAEVVGTIEANLKGEKTVLVILDSGHTRQHVRAELELYSRFVTPGSYLIAADGVMRELTDVPRGEASWVNDNPAQAAQDFLASHPEFRRAMPGETAGAPELGAKATYFTDGWMKRER